MTGALDLADRQALTDLVARYALAVDTRDFADLHQVFVPDATLDTGRAVRTGMDQITDAMQGLLRYESTSHLLGQQVVQPTDDGATGITYCTAHHLTVDGDLRTDTVMQIHYHDRYVRTDDGWRIVTRRLDVRWRDTQPVS
ncbi:MAG: hypothetical protein DHS20C19_24150 [Acidimicrobiales bacterium]|nr:MAG: hypothetical protein DHS20C19_24150 [Acidimicrobiales bacterium]